MGWLRRSWDVCPCMAVRGTTFAFANGGDKMHILGNGRLHSRLEVLPGCFAAPVLVS